MRFPLTAPNARHSNGDTRQRIKNRRKGSKRYALSMAPRTLLVWILTCAIWGTVWLCIKVGVGDVPPVTFAAFRVAVALAVLAPLIFWRRIELPHHWREIRLLATTGTLLLGVNYALLNWGIQYVSSGFSAVLQAMTPAF